MDQPRAKVFISCGQHTEEERGIAHAIKEELAEMGYDPYVAVMEQSLVGLRENIFKQLATSEYFLFVDFRREELLSGEQNSKASQEYRGSLFSHQELAIASYLQLRFLGFREEGIKERDGIIGIIQSNCRIFKYRSQLVRQVKECIKNEKDWRPDWKNELSVDSKKIYANDACRYEWNQAENRVGQKIARYFHIRVHNRNCYRNAHNCYAFLEKIQNANTKKEHRMEMIELKWAGYLYPNVVILPRSHRNLDDIFVFHDTPHIGRFNVFADSTVYMPHIEGPGDFDVTYQIASENFSSVEARFRIHLGNSLDEVRMTNLDTGACSIELTKDIADSQTYIDATGIIRPHFYRITDIPTGIPATSWDPDLLPEPEEEEK